MTRTQWGPDSRFYLSWTYRYLGHSQSAARSMAFSFLEKQGGTRCPHCFSYGTDWLFGGNGRAVVGPRVVTPGLSAPFVALFGPWGMIVPSIVCYGLAIVVLAAVTSRLYDPRWGLVAGVFMLLTVEVSRWGAMSYTEAPATLFTIAAVALLPLRRRTGRWHVVGYLVLLLLGLSTRQFAIATPCAVALAWLLVAVRIGEWLGRPVVRTRICTGTWRIRPPLRMTRTVVSTVSPRYSVGYQCANSSMVCRLAARNPEVVSVSVVCAIRDSTTDSSLIAHRRGPRTR